MRYVPSPWLGLSGMTWGLWALYWWYAARGAAPAEKKESLASRLAHIVPTVLCFLALFAPWAGLPVHAALYGRLSPLHPFGAAVTVAGALYMVWARVHLGRNWSAIVTLKEGHSLIRSGPYALTRHPIYTGYILAFLGAVLALGEWRGVFALAALVATYWRKLHVEEEFLRSRFGEEYDRYRAEVKALVPFVV
ncbi:MAG: isoprenylcysteine carboxylmethyltransferase family protein [Elusimicrobia bacterium]|nr:isoprenylcysteine carboxylmethyltransferase family protein [Elusimicrobiota bacterium]